MKKLLIFFVVVAVLGLLILPSPSRAIDAGAFLLEHYGWTMDVKQGGLFSISWGCDPSSAALNGKPYTWVCEKPEKGDWAAVVIRALTTEPRVVEENLFKIFSSKRYDPVAVHCKEEVFPSAADQKGIIRDCEVEIRLADTTKIFYFSFYHFGVGDLGFTIYIRNGNGIPDPSVKDRIRKIAASIRK